MSGARRRSSRSGAAGPARNGGRSFGDRLLAVLPLLLFASILTLMIESLGGLGDVEKKALDLQARFNPSPKELKIALVTITDDDYENLFGGRSPLDPARLGEILQAVAAGGPEVIAVDIDTSAETFRSLRPPVGPPVIWAREATFSPRKGTLRPKPFLGGARPDLPSGLVVQHVDGDGQIRRYQRVFRTPAGLVPSLAWQTYCANHGRDPLRGVGTDEFFIHFTPGELALADTPKAPYFILPASQVLEMARENPDWGESGILAGKIVILGGDYAAQDEHETPVGWLLGSEILAQTVETELAQKMVEPIGRPALALLQIAEGVLFLLLFHLLRFRTALVVGLCAIPVLAAAFSLVVFHTLGRWGSFAPILCLVLGQQIWEWLKKYRSTLVEEAAGALRTDG